uniref:Uncharacterized protein n=1 Tax=Oryza punctata TaxID=4537 RepID=A0A0E0MEJ3_ORYPU
MGATLSVDSRQRQEEKSITISISKYNFIHVTNKSEFCTAALYEKPRYVTKQAAKIMDQDGKLDLLIRKMEEAERKHTESEKRREISEEKSRSEFLALKLAVESRNPEVVKRVEDLHKSVVELQEKVEKLQSATLFSAHERQPLRLWHQFLQ